jgi:P-type Ca2+ transporter type 2C
MNDKEIERAPAPWHALSLQEVLERVESHEEGLTGEAARERIARSGANTLEAEKETSAAALVLKQIRNPLIYLLLAAVALSLLIGEVLDAVLIAAIVVINTIIGVWHEWRAEQALEALREMAAPHARVSREGAEQEIESAHIARGDILILKTGDRVAADARLLKSNDLQIDESALTGESEPVAKEPGQLPEDTEQADRSNMAWMSTVVTQGSGRAVVVATGMDSVIGEIAGAVRETEREETPLQRRLGRLGLALGAAGVILGIGVFGLGLLRGYMAADMVLFAAAVVVSLVPAGLPAVISVTLAVGVQRMAARHSILRRLAAVETLGSTTVICSDKTGTITANQMTAVRLWAGGKEYEVTGQGYSPEGQIRPADDSSSALSSENLPVALKRLLTVGALANNASLTQENGDWLIEGDPTDGATLVAARKVGIDPEELHDGNPRIDQIPFASEHRYMAVLYSTGNEATEAYVKGAPERLTDFCTHILVNGERAVLTEERRREIADINRKFAGQALRVLAGAYRTFPADQKGIEREQVEEGLTFIGLWGMLDPPREEAVEAIREVQGAGIRVVMLTGDHAVTAAAIARKSGITDEEVEAVTGQQVEGMTGAEVAERALGSGVFARVSPTHKLKILEALKERNQIVAMTGDGVNDAPSLKAADIGVAMGQTGTEVAKEAADMVLTDDNFATIVHAVEEGRSIFSNLQRVVWFVITTSASEVLILTLALLAGLPLPLSALMIVWINFVTDGACTIPLGLEPRHANVLKQPPRPPQAHILHGRLILRILLLAPVVAAGTLGIFLYYLEQSSLPHARTIAFTTLAAFQWFQAFNARSTYLSIFAIGLFTNRWLLLGVGGAIVLQILVVYTSLGQSVFGLVPLTLPDWALVVLVASLLLVADEILKRLRVYGGPETAVSGSLKADR